MDAQLRKALSGVTVVLLTMTVFTSVFVGTAGAVGASNPLETTPKTGTYQDVVAINVVNATANQKVYLCDDQAADPDACRAQAMADAANRVRDVTGTGTALFSSVTLNRVGTWHLVDESIKTVNTPWASLTSAEWKAAQNLTVSGVGLGLTGLPGGVTFTKTGILTISGAMIYNSSSAAVNGAALGSATNTTTAKVRLTYPDGNQVYSAQVDALGRFSFPDVAIGQRGAGKYVLEAFIETSGLNQNVGTNGAGNEGYGRYLWIVTPNALLGAESGNTADAKPVFGFPAKDTAYLNFTYPEDAKVVDFAAGNGAPCGAGGDFTGCLNITVTTPSGAKAYYGHSASIAAANFDSISIAQGWNDATPTEYNQVQITSKTTGAPNGPWSWSNQGEGVYTVLVKWNLRPGATVDGRVLGDNEYANTASYAFSIGKAATLNVVASLSNSDVLGRAANAAPGTRTLNIEIFGQSDNQRPGAAAPACGTGCKAAYLNVTGDLLTPISTKVLSGAGGVYAENIVLTKGVGKVNLEVQWNGSTYSKVFDLGNKSLQASASPAGVTVGTNGKVTINVMDSFGNLIPNADVQLFWLNNPAGNAGACATNYCDIQKLDGDGRTGKGQGGNYEFTVVQNLIGTIGVQVHDRESLTGTDRYGYTTFSITRNHNLVSKLNVTKLTAGVPAELKLNVTDAAGKAVTGVTASAYIFTKANYEAFAAAFAKDPTLNPVSVGADATKGFLAQLPESSHKGNYVLAKGAAAMVNGLAAGEYRLFVKNGTHDNVGVESALEVVNPTVTFSPNRISSAYLPDTKVTVTVVDHNGAPMAGALKGVNDASAVTKKLQGSAVIWGGNATCAAAGGAASACNMTANPSGFNLAVNAKGEAWAYFTGKGAGYLNWTFTPSGTAVDRAIPVQMNVVGPSVTISPNRIPQGVPSTLSLTVTDLNGNPLKDLFVALCGTPISTTTGCTDALQTDANGQVNGLGITPSAIGTVRARVAQTAAGTLAAANATSATVTVFSGMQLLMSPATPQVGDSVTILATKIAPGNPPLANARIVVKDPAGAVVLNKTTAADGSVSFIPSAQGEYAVSATLAGFDDATSTLAVSAAKPVHTPKANIVAKNLAVSSESLKVGEAFQATVELVNSGDAAGTASIKLKVDGITVQTLSTTVAANNGTEKVGLSFTPVAVKLSLIHI